MQYNLEEERKKSIEDCQFSVRAYDILYYQLKIKNVAQLCTLSAADIMSTKNCGKKSLKEVTDYLAERTLSLRNKEIKNV